jgi:hypothetical protein
VYEGSFFPASLPTFIVVCVLDGGYFNRSEIGPLGGFDLHFLYGQGW